MFGKRNLFPSPRCYLEMPRARLDLSRSPTKAYYSQRYTCVAFLGNADATRQLRATRDRLSRECRSFVVLLAVTTADGPKRSGLYPLSRIGELLKVEAFCFSCTGFSVFEYNMLDVR